MSPSLASGYGNRFGEQIARIAHGEVEETHDGEAHTNAMARYDRWFFGENSSELLLSASKKFRMIDQHMAAAEVEAATKENMAILGDEACDLFMSKLPKNHRLRKSVRSSVLSKVPYLGAAKFGEVVGARHGDTYSVTQMFIANFDGELDTSRGATYCVPLRLDFDQMYYGLHVLVDKFGSTLGFDHTRGRHGVAFKTKDMASALYSIASASTGLSRQALRARAAARVNAG